MHSSFVPPPRVKIGEAASFVGITPRAIRHYHEIGLLPEPERGSDDRRRYGYSETIRLLWIRTMADAGIALDDIRDAFADMAPAEDERDHGQDVAEILERLEQSLLAREAELQRQRALVRRMRTRGSRMGLLSDVVTSRLEGLPAGSLRQEDLDTLLVTERIFGPLGAAVQATRFLALATHPGLRQESDRVDAAEEALDDTVDVDDPRVAQVASERHAFEVALHTLIEESGLAEEEDELVESWESAQPIAANPVEEGPGGERDRSQGSRSALEAVASMPHDFAPARLRCLELAEELATRA